MTMALGLAITLLQYGFMLLFQTLHFSAFDPVGLVLSLSITQVNCMVWEKVGAIVVKKLFKPKRPEHDGSTSGGDVANDTMEKRIKTIVNRIADINSKDAHIEFRDNVKKLMTNLIKEERMKSDGKGGQGAEGETKSSGQPMSKLEKKAAMTNLKNIEKMALQGVQAGPYSDNRKGACTLWRRGCREGSCVTHLTCYVAVCCQYACLASQYHTLMPDCNYRIVCLTVCGSLLFESFATNAHLIMQSSSLSSLVHCVVSCSAPLSQPATGLKSSCQVLSWLGTRTTRTNEMRRRSNAAARNTFGCTATAVVVEGI